MNTYNYNWVNDNVDVCLHKWYTCNTRYAFLLLYTELKLKTLLDELYPVRVSWYNIGLQLDIPHTTLDCFKQNYSDQSDLMREMLKCWFDSAVNPPTWEAVVTALKSRIVNKKKVADELESKYIVPVHCIGEKSNSPTKVEKSKGNSTYYIHCTYRSCLLLTNNIKQLLLHF